MSERSQWRHRAAGVTWFVGVGAHAQWTRPSTHGRPGRPRPLRAAAAAERRRYWWRHGGNVYHIYAGVKSRGFQGREYPEGWGELGLQGTIGGPVVKVRGTLEGLTPLTSVFSPCALTPKLLRKTYQNTPFPGVAMLKIYWERHNSSVYLTPLGKGTLFTIPYTIIGSRCHKLSPSNFADHFKKHWLGARHWHI